MVPRARVAAGVVLILAGAALAIFFSLLLGIADCTEDCQRRGERAPAFALVGAGFGLVLAGAVVSRLGGRQAFGVGFLAMGAAAALIGIVYVSLQAYAYGGWTAAAGLVAAIVGGGLLRRPQ